VAEPVAEARRELMLVRQIMTPTVTTINPEASLYQAAILMRDNDFGWLPVAVDQSIIGVVSDRDIAVRTVSIGLDPRRYGVEQAMSPNVVWCRLDDTVEEAASRMKESRVRRLLVLDEQNRLMGVLSLGDLAARLDQGNLGGIVLSSICS
jgi:CBS domain-containing protein